MLSFIAACLSFLLAWMILQMFTVLIRARSLSPLRHILFLCKFSYRHAFTSSWRTKSVSVLSSVAHFVKISKNHLPSVRELSPDPQNHIPTAPESSQKLSPRCPNAPPRLPTAPDRARERSRGRPTLPFQSSSELPGPSETYVFLKENLNFSLWRLTRAQQRQAPPNGAPGGRVGSHRSRQPPPPSFNFSLPLSLDIL